MNNELSNSNGPQETEMTTFMVIEIMNANLKKLDRVAKTLEKESIECKNAHASLKGSIREIDGAIRGTQR